MTLSQLDLWSHSCGRKEALSRWVNHCCECWVDDAVHDGVELDAEGAWDALLVSCEPIHDETFIDADEFARMHEAFVERWNQRSRELQRVTT